MGRARQIALERWTSLFRSDARFDVPDASLMTLHDNTNPLFCFRLTGAKHFNFTLAQLHARGIQLDSMNMELVSDLNFTSSSNTDLPCVLLTHVVGPVSVLDTTQAVWVVGSVHPFDYEPIVHALLNDSSMDIAVTAASSRIQQRFELIQLRAVKILEFVFRHVHHCRCEAH
jgi:hypothetical protein